MTGSYTNVEAWSIALLGNTLVLAAATRDAAHSPKLDVLNLSSPSAPVSAGSLMLDAGNGIAEGITIVSNWAFVGRPEKAVDLINLANPS